MDTQKKKLILPVESTIVQAMIVLNEVPLGIVMLVDSEDKLCGVATDGDIRRAITEGASIDTPIDSIMSRDPVVVQEGYSITQILRVFSNKIRQVPVVDDTGRIVDLLFYSEFSSRVHISTQEQIIRAKAPLRISFAGGGTDVTPYIEKHGGVVLSTTINRHCYGTLRKRDDEKIVIHSHDYDTTVEVESVEKIKLDGKLDLIKSVISLMKPNFGMELYFESDVPPGTGLGGSATVAAVTVGLLNQMRELKFDNYQMAEIAFQAERIEMGISGGWQDQYAAVFGGFNFIEFKTDDIVVHSLRIKEDILNELECSLLLCYTGQTRNSGNIVKSQTDSYVAMNKEVVQALDRTKEIALEVKNALLRGDLTKFGNLLHKAWLIKKKFDKQISNSWIDTLYDVGLNAGALGGKVLGAGGGGYILFYCPHLLRKGVAAALQEEGGQILDFNFDFDGLKTWQANTCLLK